MSYNKSGGVYECNDAESKVLAGLILEPSSPNELLPVSALVLSKGVGIVLGTE